MSGLAAQTQQLVVLVLGQAAIVGKETITGDLDQHRVTFVRGGLDEDIAEVDGERVLSAAKLDEEVGEARGEPSL